MSNYLVDVVEIPSDDEEIVANDSIRQNNSLLQLEASEPPKPDVSVVPELKKQKLECRSFWKAGSYEIGPSSFVPAHGNL